MSTPALPDLVVMQLWLHVGWALVLAGGGAAVLAQLSMPLLFRRVIALVLGLWVLMPGNLSAAYWLGLAFQAPSVLGALACAYVGWAALRPTVARAAENATRPLRWEAGLVVCGVLLGWALLLDTFAQLPSALYPLGFGQPVLLALLVVAVLPLLQVGAVRRVGAWLAPVALLLFVLLRLPTGNAFDVVLDPWLWVVLHGVALRWLYCHWKIKG
ncbi:hypothetical protein AEP_03367 [Curvibacter sp. AEP1-3]|uniref:hypothetical protein n=1 Tax=Curvibacter sp. AEP1-3 TaxID=1844971 RepID=UPI000B3CCA82|nr:hypothetical protein [Curvibacter sp. AEP1-3]ARV20289.1 hypothetical protein AEP_03367 [Curvibacter sp. AEP1-3]